jgi:mono/diheme cytochrome c family protein
VRKLAWSLGGLVAVVVLVAGLFIGWTLLFRPLARPVTDRTFAATTARLARGRYVVKTVALCIRCHSPNEMHTPAAGTEGSGWVLPLPPDNPSKHRIVAPNITPDIATGIGGWTDDEIGRAVREGLDREGRSFGYTMPSFQYRNMGDEDLAAVVVYLRSLKPIRQTRPRTTYVFPVQFLVRMVPQPVNSPVMPDLSTAAKRGEYLATVATCNSCHTPHDFAGHLMGELAFAGGDVLRLGPEAATGTNLTPDSTGLGGVSADVFHERMRGRKRHGVMPYDQYAGLTEADLDDLYAYLRILPPIRHVVDGAAPETLCRVCKKRHGGGERN